YHNTVQLKDGEIHSFERGLRSALWRMEDRAGAQTLHWGPDGDRILFRGSVDSYREKTGLRVFRDISWNRSAARLSVLDSVQAVRSSDSTGIVTAVSRFLLAPGISIRPVGEQKLDLYAGADRLARFSTSPGVALSVRNLWFSPQYGERIPTLQIEGSWRADEAAPASFEILLHP
ncbi:MAG: heparinase II/III family protein, partial [Kiritimatiellia bacterium]|nr:heparinase II/III family protein [Kiritimatiellia bacterium]